MNYLATFIKELKKRLDTLNCSYNDIEKIIQNVDSNKAHWHVKISIHMIKIYGKSICMNMFSLPLKWKKANCSPIL